MTARSCTRRAPGARPRCTYGYDCQFAGDGSHTRVLVFDISNRAAPKQVRRIDLSGSLMAARRIGNAVHTVVADNDAPMSRNYQTWPNDLPMCGTRGSLVRAKFARLKRENEKRIRAYHLSLPRIRDEGAANRCARACSVRSSATVRRSRHWSASTWPTTARPAETATIQSRPGRCVRVGRRVVPGGDAFGVGHRWYSFYPSENEASEIHKFSIGDEARRETRYVGSGVVPGHVLNQFSMEQWYGYLRIATTKGRVPNPNAKPVVSGRWRRAKAATWCASAQWTASRVGEDIRAVRFDGDRGYVVTFKKTDPLFVLDLYHPSKPSILGELKIPGFSTYLHRIDPDHLLGHRFRRQRPRELRLLRRHHPTALRCEEPHAAQADVPREDRYAQLEASAAATDHLAFNYLPRPRSARDPDDDLPGRQRRPVRQRDDV